MTLNILFAAPRDRWADYCEPLSAALISAGIDAQLATDLPPEAVDYIVYAPGGPVLDFSVFTRAKAVLSLWAGVETILTNPTLKLPLARMVDEGLALGMRDYVCGHVLRHHLGMDAYIVNPDHAWAPVSPPLARDRTVGVLGLGALGQTCAIALAGLGFSVLGWSRRQKGLGEVSCHYGKDGLEQVLSRAEILVLLLPETPVTRTLLDASRLARLPQGAVVINPGRGALIDDDALLAALDRNLSHATLDTFRREPLPSDHPFWTHPKITVTPHIASATRPDTASAFIARNIKRFESRLPLLGLVDRDVGY